MEKTKIIVVDDNETFLKGIIFYLEHVLLHEVIGYATNGKEFLNLGKNTVTADIILMDIQMPEINGFQATKKFLSSYNYSKIIAVTNFPDMAYLRELIYTGFKGCVYKSRIYEELPAAIDSVSKGKLYFPENIKL